MSMSAVAVDYIKRLWWQVRLVQPETQGGPVYQVLLDQFTWVRSWQLHVYSINHRIWLLRLGNTFTFLLTYLYKLVRFLSLTSFTQCSIWKNQWRVKALKAPRGWGVAMPPQQKIYVFFYFTIVHSVALSYTNSEVLFAIKCRERYVITGFLAINSDTDIKT